MSDIETRLSHEDPGVRALAAVGLSEDEEGVYLALLGHPGATLREIVDSAGLTRKQVRDTLVALEAKGMLTRSLNRTPRFRPTPPAAALEALIAERQRQLNAVRWHAERLAERATVTTRRRGGGEIVELVAGADAIAAGWQRLCDRAKDEVLMFVRSPFPHREASRSRGVSVRAVYDRDGLSESGAGDILAERVNGGEQVRVYSPLPVDIVITDRGTAMIPLVVGEPDAVALLLRPCGLLDAAVVLFETVWQRASPFVAGGVDGSVQADPGTEPVAPDLERILPLLAVGLRDEHIARDLGISLRTLDRRLRAMMDALNAVTRFQAGWLAANRYHPDGEVAGSPGGVPVLGRGEAGKQDDHA